MRGVLECRGDIGRGLTVCLGDVGQRLAGQLGAQLLGRNADGSGRGVQPGAEDAPASEAAAAAGAATWTALGQDLVD